MGKPCEYHFTRDLEVKSESDDLFSLPTYSGFGAGAVLMLIYMTNWETVGRRIPIWKYHFEPISIENNNPTNATST
ncbi:unnamed protein product [Brugia pahangi]|uniref:Transmembrane protein n=1 Tax=Brugia pahangi TaxID=6280 RepID=A0A0N4TJN8_BRUPA|nr:unnamed protein product [Brugia pahangi]